MSQQLSRPYLQFDVFEWLIILDQIVLWHFWLFYTFHPWVAFSCHARSSLITYVNWLNVKANAERWYGDAHKPRRNRLHNMSCDNDKAKPLKEPSMDLTRPHPARPVRLLWNFIIWWYGTRGSPKQLLHGSALMCSSLTVKIKGPGWGWGGRTTAPRSEESLLWIWRLALEIYANISPHLVGGVSATTSGSFTVRARLWPSRTCHQQQAGLAVKRRG